MTQPSKAHDSITLCSSEFCDGGNNQKWEGLLKQGVIETHYTEVSVKNKQYNAFNTCKQTLILETLQLHSFLPIKI